MEQGHQLVQIDNIPVLRLRALVEADPGALVHVLQLFQMRNVVPRSVASERIGDAYVQICIELDAAELAPESFSVVVAKINELPIAIAAVASSGPTCG